jgi:hypothetical protein
MWDPRRFRRGGEEKNAYVCRELNRGRPARNQSLHCMSYTQRIDINNGEMNEDNTGF